MGDYYYFMVEGIKTPLGYVRTAFVQAVSWPEGWVLDHERRLLVLACENGFVERTAVMQATIGEEAEHGGLGEMRTFPVYAADGQHVLDMDGCAVDLFGIRSFSVQMILFVDRKEGRRYWIARRARSRMSYAGMLDVAVGGSLATGEKAIDCITRETEAKTSISSEYTRDNIVPCGTLSYQMTLDNSGHLGCQPQVQYMYEMRLDEDMVPRSSDGKVEEFYLVTLEEVQDSLARGEFKLNCAMTWMDFFIRHGYLTAENEENLVEICAKLHRKHEFFLV